MNKIKIKFDKPDKKVYNIADMRDFQSEREDI